MSSYLIDVSHWLEGHTQRWLRWLMIVGVLVATVYLAPRASERHLLVLIGLGGLLVIHRWPQLGLAAVIVGGLAVPASVGTGTGTQLNVGVLLVPVLLGLWLLQMLAKSRHLMVHSRPVLPLLAFAGTAVFSFVAGNQSLLYFAQPAPLQVQLGGLAVFLLSAGAFLLAGHQIRDVRWLRTLTWLFLALGAVYIAGRIVPGGSGPIEDLFRQSAGNSLFWVWTVALASSQALFNRQLRPALRAILALLAAATILVAFVQTRDWISGWLPAMVTIVAVLWVAAPRLAMVAVLGGIAWAVVDPALLVNIILVGDNEYSLTTRLAAWTILTEIVEVSPAFGLGPSNYYWYTPLFSILGWHVSFNSHNNFVDIVAQMGLVGLAMFAWFMWETARLGMWLRSRVSPGFNQAYVFGALGGLAGMLVSGMLGDWFFPFVYNVGYAGMRASIPAWILLGGLLALEQTLRQQSSPPGNSR